MPDIDLPETLDTLDGVSDRLKPLYVPADGGGFRFKDVTGLETTLKAVKTEKMALEQRNKTLAEQLRGVGDIDPAEYADLRAKREQYEQGLAAADGRIDQVRLQLEQQWGQKVKLHAESETQTKQAFANYLKTEQVKAALAGAGVADEASADALSKLIASEISVEFDGASPRLSIRDSDGNPRLTENADPMGIQDLVGVYRKRLPNMFRSAGLSGSGASEAAVVDAPNGGDPSKWTDPQRQAFIKKHGHEAYRAHLARHAG